MPAHLNSLQPLPTPTLKWLQRLKGNTHLSRCWWMPRAAKQPHITGEPGQPVTVITELVYRGMLNRMLIPDLCPLHTKPSVCPAQPGSYFPHQHPKRCFNFPACPDSFPVVTVIQQAQLEPVASLKLTAREVESQAHRTHSPGSRGPLWAVTGSLLQSVDSSRVGDQGSPRPWL